MLQGMLQTPDKSTTNGEYGALGLNMAYHRENDGDQWYNYNPDKLQTREDIDRYMENYNEAADDARSCRSRRHYYFTIEMVTIASGSRKLIGLIDMLIV